MRAQVLNATARIEDGPLELVDLAVPRPGPREILVRVSACGICHTELDEIEGRLTPKIPIVPGHQIVGRVEESGSEVSRFRRGDRVGIAWIHSACGRCRFCVQGAENLCADARWTGKDVDGGYAEYTLVGEDFAYPIPEAFSDLHAAPLLCAGAIGYRALKLSGLRNGGILGLYGFGASAHIVIQVARHLYPDCTVFVFSRNDAHQELARRLGAVWTGAATETPPAPPHCAIDFTPIGSTIREALRVLERGGRLVVNVIRKRDPVPSLDYTSHLWQEKEVKSVANLTRQDAEELLRLAAAIPIVPEVSTFGLEDANAALALLKQGAITGAAVLQMRGAAAGSRR